MGHRIEVMSEGSVDLSVQNGLATAKVPIMVYNINDDSLSPDELERMRGVLADPIVDISRIDGPVLTNLPASSVVIEQTPNPNVTDSQGETTRKLFSRMFGREIGAISFSNQFVWNGPQEGREFTELRKMLVNPLSRTRFYPASDWQAEKGVGFHLEKMEPQSPPAYQYIDISGSDENLARISTERYLALNIAEMHAIRDLFQDTEQNQDFLRRRRAAGLTEDKPTDADLEGIAQKWSDHCKHKKFNALYKYKSEDPNDESGLPPEIDSLFKSIIKNSTLRIIRERGLDWLVSVFEDNAGVIKLNDRYNVIDKVETHNHPTSIEAKGGANTGIGGVIRDPAGTGIAAPNVIKVIYGFRNSPFDSIEGLPDSIQTPRRAFYEMIAGVEDYGNKMGIPNSSGTVMFHRGWFKPAVFCGATSVVSAEINGVPSHTKNIEPGFLAYSIGGKVGRDGMHGATGSSSELQSGSGETEQMEQSVQIGNPIEEKNFLEVEKVLLEHGLIEASQDCGAGGWNSAVSELTELLNELEGKRYEIQARFREKGISQKSGLEEKLGAVSDIVDCNSVGSPFVDRLAYEIRSGAIFNRISNGKGGSKMDLTHVPEKYKGLTGWEKEISEAQERQVIVVRQENAGIVEDYCRHYNVPATLIAKFNDSGYYQVLDQDKTISFLPIEFFDKSLPQMVIQAHYKPCQNKEPEIPVEDDLTETFLKLLSRPNIQMYDWISTRFDHEVQGRSLTKPIVGKGRGKNDSPALRPVHGEPEVLIETWGSNLWQGDIDGYHMGRNNVVDAIGRVIAAGGNLERIAYNGNTTCPRPDRDPAIAATVVRMLQGSAHAEVYFGTPRISGKDSPNMERDFDSTITGENENIKSKPELLITGISVLKDESTLTTPDFKVAGDVVYVIGQTRDELGGSEFYDMHNETGRNVPKSNFDEIKSRYDSLPEAIKSGLVHSCQYVGRGGLGVALANCSISGDLGADIRLDYIDKGIGRADKILFSETTGRFVVSVPQSRTGEFESMMHGVYCREIGYVQEVRGFRISYGLKDIVNTNVQVMREKNKGEVRDKLS